MSLGEKLRDLPRRAVPLWLAAAVAFAAAAGAVLIERALVSGLPLGPAQRESVEALVRDYLRQNPEAVGAAINKLMERRRAEEQERVRLNIRALASDLRDDPDSPVAGNPDGDVTVVEFFDYACPYCKALAGDLKALIAEDRSLRFVFKEFPVLGPISTFAARAALAARSQGKYVEFHFALMSLQGRLSEDAVLATAARLGLDVARLKEDMELPDIDAIIKRNKRVAQGLGINGTPAFVIGEELVPGFAEPAYLKELIARERAGAPGSAPSPG